MVETPSTDDGTAEGRYLRLQPYREAALRRARVASKLTIPSLIPPEGHNETSDLDTPYQGIGARGVNTLAAKLLLALFPPNASFFRLSVSAFAVEKSTKQKGLMAEIEKALTRVETEVMQRMEKTALRVPGFEALKQLIVAGNVLLFLRPDGSARVYRLDRYVVRRDPAGNVLEIVAKDVLDPRTVADVFKDEIELTPASHASKTVSVYTHIKRTDAGWEVYQECRGKEIPDSRGSYPLDKSPWIPLRFTRVDGEDYGRGHVEEYIGDLKSLEGLTAAVVEAAAVSSKVVFLVNPNGVTKVSSLAKAETGSFVAGNPADVQALQVQKFADLRVAQETMAAITQRLSFAFLMNTAIQRSGERVTAEEIRYMAGELEDALGGVYSILSQELQRPLVTRLLHQMTQEKAIPGLPKEAVGLTITTGLEALGRGHDLTKLRLFLSMAVEAANLPDEMNRDDYLTRVATAIGLNTDGLVKTREEVEALRAQQNAAAMVQQLGPKAMDIARDQMNPANAQNPAAAAGG
jgi:hypothetical protein